MEKDISIIIPTYKPEQYLKECLASISNQSLSKYRYELIIILNGCFHPWIDNIIQWVRSHNLKESTRIMQTNIAGVSHARNIGLENAKGRFITFIDDDDYISPHYLEEMLINSSEECVALSDSSYFIDGSETFYLDNIQHNTFVKHCTSNNPSILKTRAYFNGPWMKLINKQIIGNIRFDERLSNDEDSLFMTLISKNIKQLTFTSNKAIYYRRMRKNSASARKRSFTSKIKNSLTIWEAMISYIIKDPLSYNLPFTLSRFAAGIKNIFLDSMIR